MSNAELKMPGGVPIPVLGLGVYQSRAGAQTRDAVLHAFKTGYRHVDTAAAYGNEADVGEAVRQSGLPRDQVFITTKLWNSDHGYEPALEAFEESRKKLGLEQVDLYLIHWPAAPRLESWKALVKLKADGRCRAIGVSNFTVRHLEQVLEASGVFPDANQVELSPFLQQRELAEYCKQKGIVIEAYSPLTRGEKLHDPTIRSIAKKHARSAAQVMLRWCIEQGHVILPKSVHPRRIEENAAVFDFQLDAEDLAAIAKLDSGFRTCWDPTDIK